MASITLQYNQVDTISIHNMPVSDLEKLSAALDGKLDTNLSPGKCYLSASIKIGSLDFSLFSKDLKEHD